MSYSMANFQYILYDITDITISCGIPCVMFHG